uniref:SUN domain-containing protein n=1 Tax=Labrus bergylta TaxID=56723 RepID=A0A3Q3N2N0_9LABR
MYRHSNTDTLGKKYRHSNMDTLDKNGRYSMDRESQSPTMFNSRNLGFLFFVLSLCSGLTFYYFFATPRDNLQESQHSQLPVSSTLTNKDMNSAYEDMAEQLRRLQDELQSLRKDINILHPIGNTLPNFALHSQGASIIHHLTSKTYFYLENDLTFFGISLGISQLVPGNCWSFKGGQGHLVIALSHPTAISHVSLGHISKTLSPTLKITSAPKEFTVYGMETEEDPGTKLGRFLYDEDGDQLQTFNIPSKENKIFKYVKLQVENNWGNPDYSCLYSFKVHWKMATKLQDFHCSPSFTR